MVRTLNTGVHDIRPWDERTENRIYFISTHYLDGWRETYCVFILRLEDRTREKQQVLLVEILYRQSIPSMFTVGSMVKIRVE